MKNNIRAYNALLPTLHSSCFVDPFATIIGDVTLAANVSVWPGVVIRGDVNHIGIGEQTNIQDLSVLHVTHKSQDAPVGAGLQIGNRVTVGHRVILHGCTIGDEVLVGMGCIILDHAVIEPQVLIGAGSLVPPRKRLESGYLYFGNPVKAVRPLTEAERAHLVYSAEHYVRLAQKHKQSILLS